MKYLYQKQINL